MAGSASERVLRFALRRLRSAPVGVLVTRRRTDAPAPLGLDETAPGVRVDRLPGPQARAGVNRALDADVLPVEEGRLRFTHPLLGVAALARVRPSAGRAVHARLATIAGDRVDRAHHLVAAAEGPDAGVAAAFEQGADLARARGAPEVAAELAEAAVRLTPSGQLEDLDRRRVAAGYHRATAGEMAGCSPTPMGGRCARTG